MIVNRVYMTIVKCKLIANKMQSRNKVVPQVFCYLCTKKDDETDAKGVFRLPSADCLLCRRQWAACFFAAGRMGDDAAGESCGSHL